MTQEQYVDFCMSRIDKNFELPKLPERSKSNKDLNQIKKVSEKRNS